jgi:CDP-diacylglycerol--glycerol-3-phosphate 3-phosphatidyltransferase
LTSPKASARVRSLGRVLGLRRGREGPPETRLGEPLHPLTIPNLVGYSRIALLVAFMAIALASDDGRVTVATICFAAAAASDYLDGLLARLTGQFSRLGRLMDPVIDRLVAVSGAIVAWRFELLPRAALAVLLGREVLMLALGALALRARLDIEVNWTGRWSVWLTMSALGLALIAETPLAEVLLWAGIAGSLAATLLYVREGVAQLASRSRPARR